ncbi:hypothetical protein GPECTOR_17g824 [Gonium pectorale]|uniref:Glycosyl transferase CAP10 domain-containing protein n=1 Tax=Gonium pectorale TaxID=33097 RepID=A0A150GK74_GONPE|nr:hypothetical protein GPECTOR_17g824 [Gonium pectorale]|eukprot:KXZ50187.1 hypothetical protein GPECTOR_17g824 [Gonium pectorale]
MHRDNLDADFIPWRKRRYRVAKLHEMLSKLAHRGDPGAYLCVIVIKNGTVMDLPYIKNYKNVWTAKNRVRNFVSGLLEASRGPTGLVLPDTAFLFSVRDTPHCGRKGDGCKVPVFAPIKRWDFSRNASDDYEVLLPQFANVYTGELVFYPWEKKADKALLRSTLKARMKWNSTRQWLVELGARPGNGALLDTGVIANEIKGFKPRLSKSVSIPDHARWRYIFHTDGITASSRLGKVLAINSVVLKEESHWIEYWYRSLIPNVHYVPFNKENVLQVVSELQRDPQRCQRIADAAQHFMYRHFSQRAKAMYTRAALTSYNALFDDMAAFMASFSWDALKAAPGGPSVRGLLDQMKAFLRDPKPKAPVQGQANQSTPQPQPQAQPSAEPKATQ